MLHKEFITREEQKNILEWVDECKKIDSIRWRLSNGKRGRFQLLVNLPYNNTIQEIKKRVIKKFNLYNLPSEVKFQDFIGILSPLGYIKSHTDNYSLKLEEPKAHLRYNILVQLPFEGGRNIYNDEILNVEERMLLEYRPDLYSHGCTPISAKSKKTRINLSFGFNK